MSTDERHCQGMRKDGSPCQAPPGAILNDGFCFAHSPSRQEARRAAQSRGGRNRSGINRALKALPKDLQDVREVLLRALGGVEGGTLSPARAVAMATVARALAELQKAGEIEARLAAIETYEAERKAQ